MRQKRSTGLIGAQGLVLEEMPSADADAPLELAEPSDAELEAEFDSEAEEATEDEPQEHDRAEDDEGGEGEGSWRNIFASLSHPSCKPLDRTAESEQAWIVFRGREQLPGRIAQALDHSCRKRRQCQRCAQRAKIVALLGLPIGYDRRAATQAAEAAASSVLLNRFFAELGMKDEEVALHCLVSANLRLNLTIARRLWRPGAGTSFYDVWAYGHEGLIRGVAGFDPRRGYKLNTYASWWVRNLIIRNLADNEFRTIRLPVHRREFWRKAFYLAWRNDHDLFLADPKLVELLANAFGMSEKMIRQILGELNAAGMSPRPLDESELVTSSLSLAETVPDMNGLEQREENVEDEFRRYLVRRLLRSLRPDQVDLLSERFGIGRRDEKEVTLIELGKRRSGISKQAISHRLEVIFARLRALVAREEAILAA